MPLQSQFNGTERWMVIGMADKCENCTEKCPQAEMAHQAALGRMYATKEFTALLKKVESGELVEVVRCKDCKYMGVIPYSLRWCHVWNGINGMGDEGFCNYGERKDNERKAD